jgi:RimJ/RimL family protein N-acetyltransferase
METVMGGTTTPTSEQRRACAQLPRYFRWFTEHCVLRQLDGADVRRIWRAVVQPAFNHCWSGQAPGGEREVKDLVRTALTDWMQGTAYSMAVVKRQTHELVGYVGMRSVGSTRTVWTIDWFTHPNFLGTPIAVEAITATGDLTFAALGAQKLYAGCPAGHEAFDQMLNDAGFIEVIPAGSLDQYTHKPRASSLFEMRREDWKAIRREYTDENGALSLASLGRATLHRPTLELL